MRFGVLGLIVGDLTDVGPKLLLRAREMGFGGLGAHLTVPAVQIELSTVDSVRAAFAEVPVDFLQLWGPYPPIIAPEEETRLAGVEAARDIVRLAARLGVPAAGVRPTSLNPRGDWWPHPGNHSSDAERRFVDSLARILETADEERVRIVLETHQTSVLDDPERIERIIQEVGSDRLRVNIDPVNFIGDLRTAFAPTPMIHRMFDILGPYVDTVHVKDFYLEDRFVLHISETVPGTGMMDIDTMLLRTEQISPETHAMVEHLPVSQIAQAIRHLDDRAQALGIEVVR